jgi:hypothetical protein
MTGRVLKAKNRYTMPLRIIKFLITGGKMENPRGAWYMLQR